MTIGLPASLQEIRQRAEDLFRASEAVIPEATSPEEINLLLHELRVHQIELEMQNEELRRAQEELDASQARYFDLYDLAPVGYITISDKNRIQEINLAAATMFGVPRSLLVKEPISRILPRENQYTFYQNLKQCQDSGTAHQWEMRLVRTAGEQFWAHLQVTQGQSGESWLIISDITERKETEVSLKESRNLLAETEQIGKVGGWELNIDSGIQNWTEQTYIIHEVDSTFDPNVKTSLNFFTPASRPVIECAVQRALEVGEPFDLDLEIITAKGNLRSVHTIGRADLHHRRIHGFFQDITESKRAEVEKLVFKQQFQQTQKLESLGVLAGGIAHDFNNILTVIICNCSLLRGRPHMADKLVPEIEVAAQRAADLCRQMLVYAGKAQPVPTTVKMTALVDEMVKMLKATISRNVIIKKMSSTDIPPINADASQIRQIVMNLIINAAEAIGEVQGEIRVSLVQTEIGEKQQIKDHLGSLIAPGRYVCLEVTDNGCGMDEETRWRIFEPFYTTKFTGRGLGMSAVLGIISAHHGALQLFSQRGTGTTFKAYLPAQLIEPVCDESITQVSSELWQGSGTILLVEDEPQIMLVAKILMKALGFSVLEASNGREALELYHQNAEYITLVVTDIGMPVMDGYDLLHKLKERAPELPIIISSGFGETPVSSRIAMEEVAGFLGKPYNLEQLREVLRGAMEGASPLREQGGTDL